MHLLEDSDFSAQSGSDTDMTQMMLLA